MYSQSPEKQNQEKKHQTSGVIMDVCGRRKNRAEQRNQGTNIML